MSGEKKVLIGQFAERLGVHPNTVRRYKDRGYLHPDRIGNFDVYSERDEREFRRARAELSRKR